ncbi:MAG: hypothetical protein ACTSYC_00420 [Promethearchaeota archaeon]
MGKKKKVRKKFESAFKSGDQATMKRLLDENPWLLEEVSGELKGEIQEQDQVLAALGVMEDELGHPVPIQEIIFCLKEDFSIRKSDEEVLNHLLEAEKLNLARKESNGWSLTESGGEMCDNYLNKRFFKLKA